MACADSLWRLTLLGPPQLRAPDGTPRRCEGKMLAVLAYLALEGPVPRTQLAGLLWPDTLEAGARNNLVHLLRRMRRHFGADLVRADDWLSLTPEVEVDVQDTASPGELLAGVAWPELPELSDWLLARRERLGSERAGQWRAEAGQLEAAGQWAPALEVVRRLRDLDPLSEDALRREMRLLYLQGEAAQAQAVYQDGKARLHAAFGSEPLPETQALARDIGRGALPASPTPPAASGPAQALRPPLVGRQAAWDQMEAAWAAGRGIVLTGEPGVGKTRLALDFLEAHGGGMRFRGCLGDAGLPYATHARTYRQVMAAYPQLPFAEWVREELARILPQLGPTPPPITDEAQKFRFWQAKTDVLRLAVEHGLHRMVFDDTQFMDEASIEAGAFVFSQLGWGDPAAPYRTIHCFRKGELTPLQQGTLQAMQAAQLVSVVELAPLDPPDVAQLVAGLNLDAPPGLIADLAHFSGGNPLMLLETLRDLGETERRGETLPERLPLPESAGGVIASRLARLSGAALHTARAAAVLGSDFDLDLVAQTLGTPLLETAEVWEELEAAQIVRGLAFEHDLIAQAVRSGLSGSLRRLLHRSAARTLTAHRASPARIARHWREGGEALEAAPWFVQAAAEARAAFRFGEAAVYAAEAAAAFEEAGHLDEAAALRRPAPAAPMSPG